MIAPGFGETSLVYALRRDRDRGRDFDRGLDAAGLRRDAFARVACIVRLPAARDDVDRDAPGDGGISRNSRVSPALASRSRIDCRPRRTAVSRSRAFRPSSSCIAGSSETTGYSTSASRQARYGCAFASLRQ